MTEIWCAVEEDPNYEVSHLGRVRSIDRYVPCGEDGYIRFFRGRVLRPHATHGTNYLQVVLSGRRKAFVHRLVAKAFVDGFRDGCVVNHKNGDRQDNRVENLEWVTQSENNRHAYQVLGRGNPFFRRTGADHPASKAVVARHIESGREEIYPSASVAAASIGGLDSGAISKCCHGIYRTHKGYAFTFHNEPEAA